MIIVFIVIADCFDRAMVFSKDTAQGSWSLSATLVPHHSHHHNRAISGIASHGDLAVVLASSWRGSADYALFAYKRSTDTSRAWSSQAVIQMPANIHSCTDKGCLSVSADTIAVSTWVVNSYSAPDRAVLVYNLIVNTSSTYWIMHTSLAPNSNQYPAVTSTSVFYKVSHFAASL